MITAGSAPALVDEHYEIYGLCVRSPVPLPGRRLSGPQDASLDLAWESDEYFSRVRRRAPLAPGGVDWFSHVHLPDGADYLVWHDLFEFVVSRNGRNIACRQLKNGRAEAFQTYLLGQVLSFAMLRQGIEPLHATAVAIEDVAVAFVGDCGLGKSSLGASFLQAGHRLLTDDLLVLERRGDHYLAYPGPTRIKLFPEVALAVLGHVGGDPMNPTTSKFVIPLEEGQMATEPLPLAGIYVLRAPPATARKSTVSIRPLAPRRAFLDLVENTFNSVIVDAPRLQRHFELFAQVASSVPVASLTYSRDLEVLPEVRDHVLRRCAR